MKNNTARATSFSYPQSELIPVSWSNFTGLINECAIVFKKNFKGYYIFCLYMLYLAKNNCTMCHTYK